MKIGLKPLLSLVLMLTIIIPAGAIILTGISASRAQATQAIAGEVTSLSYAQSVGLDVLLDECVTSLHTLAQFEEIKQTAGENYSSVKEDTDLLLAAAMKAGAPYLLNIIVIDINGFVSIDSFGNFASPFHAFEVAGDLARGETYISDIVMTDQTYGGENTFFVLTRVGSDESVYGYICMVYSIEMFTEYLSKGGLLGEYGSMFVTDRKGTSLGVDGVPITRANEIEPKNLGEIVTGVATSTREVAATQQLNSNSHVGAYGSLSGNISNLKNSWYWLSAYPKAEIDVVPLPVLVMITVVAAVSLMFIVIGSVVIRKVTLPPQEIFKKMRRINEGEMDERLDVKGTNEYAYISEMFNDMLDEVLISGEMHRAISELSDNMLFEWDFKKEQLFVSDNFKNMFELELEKATLLNGRFIDSLMEKEDIERYKVDINKLLRSLDSMQGEYQVTTKTGSVIWISVRSHCVLDRLGELLRIVGVITNINSEKLLSLQLSERASYDFLSGLYNRNTFMRELQSEITRSASSRVGVIFIDVDDFKFINDKYGHNTGDEIIKCVANIIKDKLGSAGFAGRFGGDEFVMCVVEEETLNNIDKLATAVLELFDRGYYSKEFNVTLKIKASLGIAIAPEHGRDNETILAAADEAMYFVKKNGKCNFHIYDPEDSVLTELMHSI